MKRFNQSNFVPTYWLSMISLTVVCFENQL